MPATGDGGRAAEGERRGADEVGRRVRELTETLREAADLIVADLRAGRRQRALALLADWTDGMREILPHVGAQEDLKRGFAAVNDALARSDFVGVADALSHMVVPRLVSRPAGASGGPA